MKKTLLFVAALIISAMSFAQNKTCTWNNANAETAGIAKGGYGDLKDTEKAIQLDGVYFLAQNIMRPNNNTPNGYAADQVLQIKKKTGYFINQSAMTLVSLELIVNKEEIFEVATGTVADDLTPVTLTGADETIQLITYAGGKAGDPANVTYRKVTVDLTGKKYVKVTGLDGGKGAETPFMYKAVLTYEGSGGEVTHVTAVSLDVTEKKMAAFESLQLTATVTPDKAFNPALTWTSSNEDVAIVSATGLVNTLAPGEATITATSVDVPTISATCKLTVEAAKKSDFIAISPASLKTGDELILTMTIDTVGVLLMNSENAGGEGPAAILGGIVEGSIVPSADNFVFVATVSEKGIKFSPKGRPDSILYVSGTSSNDCVRVKKVAPKTEAGWDSVGYQWQVDATTGYLKATYLTNDGEVTRYLGVYDGKYRAYKLTAKGELSNNIKDQVLKIFVKGATPIAVTGVTLDKSEESLEIGKTLQLVATVEPADAANKDVTWSSSDEAVATVSATGLVTAVAEGEAIITVKTVDGEKTATCKVTVTAPQAIENIEVSETATKIFHDGQLFIIREGIIYNVQGARVK